MPTIDELKLLQALPLELKVAKTQARIKEFVEMYGIDGVYVSFSGGKDSTVLLDIARKMYPTIQSVYVNTGLEYPEIQSFVRKQENVTVLRPEMRFDEVMRKYGYPFIGKEIAQTIYRARHGSESAIASMNGEKTYGDGIKSSYNYEKYKELLDVDFEISGMCCIIQKERPAQSIKKAGIVGTLTEESRLRRDAWLKTGCNSFKNAKSVPLSFWTEQDILRYIKDNNIEIASVYGEIVESKCRGKLECSGCKRSGCIYCALGAQHDTKNDGDPRFLRLKRTHPKQYDYCMGGGGTTKTDCGNRQKTGLEWLIV